MRTRSGRAPAILLGLAAACLLPVAALSAAPLPPGSPGWLLDEGNTGLAGAGIDKRSLKAYAGPAKPAAGSRISLMRIDTALDLSAGDIVIERCWIRPLSIARGNQVIVTYDNDRDTAPAPAMVTLRDCDIDGTALAARDVCYSTGFAGNGTLKRCAIYGVGSGVAVMHSGSALPCLIEGNYVRALRAWGDPKADGSHNDGFTVRDYAGPSLIVRNNRFDCSSGNDTGAFFVQPYSGPIDNLLAEGNLLEGGGYQLVLERHRFDYGKNLRAVGNRFSGTGYGPGYVDRKGLPYAWAEWRDNAINDPGKPDNRGEAVAERR